MGTSVHAKVCFGIVFEEGFSFPWEESDIEDWWYNTVNGYKPPFQLYDEKGDYLNGVQPRKDLIDEYYEHREKFRKKNHLPVELVNYCCYDTPMYILAVPSTIKRVGCGDVLEIDKIDFNVSEDESNILTAFCFEHGIKYETGARWYLCSFMG